MNCDFLPFLLFVPIIVFMLVALAFSVRVHLRGDLAE